ncbi:MAG: alanine racemase [Deltaproteobacteria bacterium]|nr:alanine racemase [Deltaproteobacteria bacterium]
MESRPTFAIIDTGAIKSNYVWLKKNIAKDAEILAVVKADAYGHGAVETAKALERAPAGGGCGCNFFGVAICEEGIELRKAGIKASIVILGGVYPSQIKDAVKYDLTPVVFDIETARRINNLSKKTGRHTKVHIKIDTGMGRLGLLPYQVAPFFHELKGLANLDIEGILSHFSEADEEDKRFSHKQAGIFLQTIKIVRKIGFNPRLLHIANSAAIVGHMNSHFNLVRPGIMLYGAYPAAHMIGKIKLKPAMRLVSQVVQLKKAPKGFPVSYGRKYITKKDSVIAAIPIGYGDGYPRHLSNNGQVLIRGQRARVAGMVCMDITMVDVTHIKDVSQGDEVVLIGRQGNDEITADELAEKAGTISYEILCGITSRVPRVYV